MKRITDSFIKNIVRQSLNENRRLLNEDPQSKTYKTGPIMYGDVQYDNLDLTENPCPRGGFCLTPAKKSAYSNASNFVKSTKIPTDVDSQVTWMDSVINLCNNPEYAMGESMDETTINSIVTEIIEEMDDTAIDEEYIKKKIVSLGDFPSFCVASEYSNRMSYNIFNSDAKNRVAGGGGDDDDYKTFIVMPVFGLLQNSVNKSKKFETTFWESVASVAKTQKPNTTKGGGGTQNTTLDIGAFPCIVEHPALINKKESLENGFGFRLKTGNPVIDDFTFGVTKDPNVPDSRLEGKKFSNKSQILLDFDCNDKYIQVSLSSNVWNYDDVSFGGAWGTNVGGKLALTTDPDLEDDGKINNSIQLENIKGFRYKLLTEAEYKLGDTGPDVGKIQSKLGLAPDKGTPTYGPKTKTAVEKFQKDNGLPVTGDIDSVTYDKIIEKYPDPIQQTGTGWTQDLKVGMSGTDVEFIQTKLGISKGKYGPETEKKVKEFQIKYKLPETGIVDKTTYDKLIQVKAAGTPSTYSGKKHNYIKGEWIKVTPESGNEAAQLLENNGYFRILDTPNPYTIVLDLDWGGSFNAKKEWEATKGYATVGGSTQKVLFGEQASEGSKTVIKRDRTTEKTSGNRQTVGGGGNGGSGTRQTVGGGGEDQRKRDIRKKETCDTLRQIKQYLNNTKGLSMTVNCVWNQEIRNQVMLGLTGGTPAPAPTPIEEPKVSTPGGNTTVY